MSYITCVKPGNYRIKNEAKIDTKTFKAVNKILKDRSTNNTMNNSNNTISYNNNIIINNNFPNIVSIGKYSEVESEVEAVWGTISSPRDMIRGNRTGRVISTKELDLDSR